MAELPESFRYVWQWFLELQTGKAITYLEIDAWARLNHIELKLGEVQKLMALERLLLLWLGTMYLPRRCEPYALLQCNRALFRTGCDLFAKGYSLFFRRGQ
ncbi:MAG TPA: hypothetical protein DER02_08570 [Gammaproteobacteria bacterium]|nr:hypothetical protein [Gammaproteobacteria bacterium]